VTERILSLSLRPKTLSALYGQQKLVDSVRAHVAKRPPQTWLIHGATGCGKTTLARIMSVAYQCPHQQLWGDPCKACRLARSGFAIHEINASDVSGVEELGRVADMSRYRPTSGRRRVIILDEFQRATPAAQNLLLKPFEEPPPTTVWIVCTTEPSKILPTLRRRCVTVHVRGLGFDAAEKFLAKTAAETRGLAVRDLPALVEAARFAGLTAPALLLQALEKYAAGASAAEACAGAEGVSPSGLAVCKAVTAGNWNALRALLLKVPPEEARLIRGSVSGWLRGCMARGTDPKDLDRAAASLSELTGPAPLDDAQMLLWLWPVLFRACRRYGGRK